MLNNEEIEDVWDGEPGLSQVFYQAKLANKYREALNAIVSMKRWEQLPGGLESVVVVPEEQRIAREALK